MNGNIFSGKWFIRGENNDGTFQIRSDAPVWQGFYDKNGIRNNMKIGKVYFF